MRQSSRIQRTMAANEALIRNVIPPSVLQRIRASAMESETKEIQNIVDTFAHLVVLQLDIVGFTEWGTLQEGVHIREWLCCIRMLTLIHTTQLHRSLMLHVFWGRLEYSFVL